MTTLKLIIYGSIFFLVAGSIFLYSMAVQFKRQVVLETETLSARAVNDAVVVTEADLEDLPDPVQKWLRNSGVIGRERIQQISLKQKGQMRLQPDQKSWIKTEASQYFITKEPGFLWTVRMKMKGIPISGRDFFIDGKGSMIIKAAGGLTMVQASDHPKINQSTLQRYLGEVVWFPTAALMPYITWEAIDSQSARATMTAGDTSGSAVFFFTEQGDIEKFIAWRFKDKEDAQPTEWQATVKRTEEVNGIRIPVELEASWIEENGVFTWYTFEIYDVVYS